MLDSMLQILLNGLVSGCTYSIVAIGFFLTYRSARFFDLSYAATLSIGAFITYASVVGLRVWEPLAVAIGVTASACAAVLFEVTAYRFLRRYKAPALVRLLASLGLMIASFNVLSVLFGDAAVLAVTDPPSSIAIGSARITAVRIYTSVVAIGVFGFCWLIGSRTVWGLKQSALFDDPELAVCLGINEGVMVLTGVACGAGVGGLASALLAIDGTIRPGLGFGLVLPAVLACMAGGFKSIARPVLCATALGVVEQAFGWFVGVAWQEVLVACLLVLVLLTTPNRAGIEYQARGLE